MTTRTARRIVATGLAGALVAGLWVPGGAVAGSLACADHDDLGARLAERFSEERTGRGLTGKGQLLELFTSPDGATWTVVLTSPGGLSCIVAAGRHWQVVEPRPAGPTA